MVSENLETLLPNEAIIWDRITPSVYSDDARIVESGISTLLAFSPNKTEQVLVLLLEILQYKSSPEVWDGVSRCVSTLDIVVYKYCKQLFGKMRQELELGHSDLIPMIQVLYEKVSLRYYASFM